MSNLNNVEFYSVRPGLIVDNERVITKPLGQFFDGVNFLQTKTPLNQLGEVKYLKDVLEYFKAEKSIERSILARAIIYLALTNTKDNK